MYKDFRLSTGVLLQFSNRINTRVSRSEFSMLLSPSSSGFLTRSKFLPGARGRPLTDFLWPLRPRQVCRVSSIAYVSFPDRGVGMQYHQHFQHAREYQLIGNPAQSNIKVIPVGLAWGRNGAKMRSRVWRVVPPLPQVRTGSGAAVGDPWVQALRGRSRMGFGFGWLAWGCLLAVLSHGMT